MPKICYRHMRVEERETLSLGLAHGHSLRTMASVLGRAPQHREPRARPQRDAWTVACLHGAHPGVGPDLSPTAAAQTPGSLAVAV